VTDHKVSQTDVSPSEKFRMFRPLDNVSLDDASLVDNGFFLRCVPCTTCSLDDVSLEQRLPDQCILTLDRFEALVMMGPVLIRLYQKAKTHWSGRLCTRDVSPRGPHYLRDGTSETFCLGHTGRGHRNIALLNSRCVAGVAMTMTN
jgi:hypothetical protein